MTKSAPRDAATKATPRDASTQSAPATAAAPRKTSPKKAATTSRGGASERETVAPMAAASPAGESYGEEGWREEELSAGEVEVDGPELEELEDEMGGPEVGGESDEDGEW